MAGSGDGGSAARMHAYHAWANGRVFGHLRTMPAGTAEREVTSVFPCVRHVLRHVLGADSLWLDVMAGLPREEVMARMASVLTAIAAADLAELESRFEDLAARYRAFLAQDGVAERPVVAVHPGGARLKTTVAELVRHVGNHGTYHRGNISAMLHQLGHRGVSTDYALFLMETRGTAR